MNYDNRRNHERNNVTIQHGKTKNFGVYYAPISSLKNKISESKTQEPVIEEIQIRGAHIED